MEPENILSIEIALAICIISVILFQLSGNASDREKQQIPAGIIIGIYIFLFGVMFILVLPYLTKDNLCREPTYLEKLTNSNIKAEITVTGIQWFINIQMFWSINVLISLIFAALIKYKFKILRTDVKIAVLTAFYTTMIANALYLFFSRELYSLHTSIWIHVIYGAYGIFFIVFFCTFRICLSDIASKNNEE